MPTEQGDLADVPPIRAVAQAILTGDSIDWPSVSSTAPDPLRPLLPHLRTLAVVADFYRDLQNEFAAFPAVGSMWGHLRLDEHIGTGAFGHVFRAWDTRLEREVALKLLPSGSGTDTDDSSAVTEARLLARLRHEHVVTVHGAEQIGGHVGLWMELVRGQTLSDEVKSRGSLPPADVVAVGIQLCTAVQAVHDAGLIHCDIKAQNVVREPGGRIVLMDFGAGRSPAATADGPGTPLYAAPELLEGGPVTERSDLYSTGVLLYYLLTGSFPYPARTVVELKTAVRAAPRPLPRSVPRRLASIVHQMLARDPALRPASAAAVVAGLQRAAAPRMPHRLLAATALFVAVIAALLVAARMRENASRSRDTTSPTLTSAERVPTPNYLMLGRPSFDGTRLSFAEEDGSPAYLDLSSLKPTQVLPGTRNASMGPSILSPDGSQVAYEWARHFEETNELRVAPLKGGPPRVLIPGERAVYVVPLEWSRDGSQILVLLHRRHGPRDLALIAVSDGSERVLRQFDTSLPLEASLSPDNRFVVFDHVASETVLNRDISIIDVRTLAATPLISHAAHDLYPEWTPDGGGVFFVSTRTGTTDGFVQDVRDGRVVGQPRAVARNLGRSVVPFGLTRGGTLYYQLRAGLMDVHIAGWDSSGRVEPAEKLQTPLEGATAQPAWSPDGRYLAYIALSGSAAQEYGAYVLVVRDIATGLERELGHGLQFFLTAPKWRSNSLEILLRATDIRGRSSFYRVNVSTGVVAPTVQNAPATPFAWFNRDREILYVSPRTGLMAHEVDTGASRTVLTNTAAGVAFVDRFGASPQGWIAYSGVVAGSGLEPGTGWPTLRLFDGGGVKELAKGNPGERFVFQCWTHDGRQILFTRYRTEAIATDAHELWLAPADGGMARPTGFTIAGHTQANSIVMHPQGRAIAFTAGESWAELWRLANFLPSTSEPRGFN